MEALIRLNGVSKIFQLESGRPLRVLDNVHLDVRAGEVIALLGPSGSGKSTCLRLMCGLHTPSSGTVESRGVPLQGINRDVALVFQSFALFPWESVYRNIEIALRPLDLKPSEVHDRILRAIDLVGLEGFEEAYPRELSGGMKQRVGLARAMAMERPLLFLDEPFSALDVLTADTLRSEILRIYASHKTAVQSMVLVTHNIQEAVQMADRILVLGANPGHIRSEFINDIEYPRDEENPKFKSLVARIHSSITDTFIPDLQVGQTINGTGSTGSYSSSEAPFDTSLLHSEAARTPSSTSNGLSTASTALNSPRAEVLPPVSLIDVSGLLEVIESDGGSADIFALADEIGTDFGSILYLVKAAELLGFVDTPRQTVLLTPEGLRYIKGDVNLRKRMVHDALSRLLIVQRTADFLKQNHIARAPVHALIEKFQEWLPHEDPEKQVEHLIAWGRFAEYFGYNDDTKTIYLDIGQETH